MHMFELIQPLNINHWSINIATCIFKFEFDYIAIVLYIAIDLDAYHISDDHAYGADDPDLDLELQNVRTPHGNRSISIHTNITTRW